ncbi:MAG: histidine--tRNA ligase [Clostridia bacterium]|nr:histidine--tRNA ligase [Clostridia bacterium]
MYQKPKGTRDILPDTIYKWQYIEDVAKNQANKFGYEEIRIPTFEHTELFLRSVGESSDIVNKEIYTFKDKGGRSLSLRPEGTAGVVRAFIENGLVNEMLPQKYFYFVNNFRYENPQAGRFREHTQFGAETFGIDTPFGELEVIDLAKSILNKIGINSLILHINSIGCSNCKPNFNKALKEFADKNASKFCEDCQRRAKTNPMRMLDCKNEKCQELLTLAPKLEDFLCEDCKNHFQKVLQLLEQNNISFIIDKNLVRGLDYYTKTVFEFVCEDALGTGKKLTACGGGRYDNLVEELGGKRVSCVGFGMGLDRIVMSLPETKKPKIDVYFANAGSLGAESVYAIAKNLREKGLKVVCNLIDRSFKSHFKYAEKINAKYICFVGEEEQKTKVYSLKDLESGTETKVNEKDIEKFLKGE